MKNEGRRAERDRLRAREVTTTEGSSANRSVRRSYAAGERKSKKKHLRGNQGKVKQPWRGWRERAMVRAKK
jgi:hypothetical protein